jgi:hypothetical protein
VIQKERSIIWEVTVKERDKKVGIRRDIKKNKERNSE